MCVAFATPAALGPVDENGWEYGCILERIRLAGLGYEVLYPALFNTWEEVPVYWLAPSRLVQIRKDLMMGRLCLH